MLSGNRKSPDSDAANVSKNMPVIIFVPEGFDLDEPCVPTGGSSSSSSTSSGSSWSSSFGEDAEVSIPGVPLSCISLPWSPEGSLLSRNLRCLRRAGLNEVFVLVAKSLQSSLEEHLQSKDCKKVVNSPGFNVQIIPLDTGNATGGGLCNLLRKALQDERLYALRSLDTLLIAADARISNSSIISDLADQHASRKKGSKINMLTLAATPAVCDGDVGPWDCVVQKNEILEFRREVKAPLWVLDELPPDTQILCSCHAFSLGIVAPELYELLDSSFDLCHFVPDLLQEILDSELAIGTVSVLPLTAEEKCFRACTPQTLSEAILPSQDSIQGYIAPGAQVAETAQIRNCVILDGAQVADGANLTKCIIAPGAQVSGELTGIVAFADGTKRPTVSAARKCLIHVFSFQDLVVTAELGRCPPGESGSDTGAGSNEDSCSSSSDSSDCLTEFQEEVLILTLQGLQKPAQLSHKLLEISSARLTSNESHVQLGRPLAMALLREMSVRGSMEDLLRHGGAELKNFLKTLLQGTATQEALLDSLAELHAEGELQIEGKQIVFEEDDDLCKIFEPLLRCEGLFSFDAVEYLKE